MRKRNFPGDSARKDQEHAPASLESILAKTRAAYNLAAGKYHELFHDEMKEKAYDRHLLDSWAKKFHEDSLICDAGCGPSGHIGKYIFDKGIRVVGVDISDRCVEIARTHNPQIPFVQGDIAHLPFKDAHFDGMISYYSIIDTPKIYQPLLFWEFHRVLKPDGYLLVAVKEGSTEGYIFDWIGLKIEICMTLFTEEEIRNYLNGSGFHIEFLEKRNPYDFEPQNTRIFTIARKI